MTDSESVPGAQDDSLPPVDAATVDERPDDGMTRKEAKKQRKAKKKDERHELEAKQEQQEKDDRQEEDREKERDLLERFPPAAPLLVAPQGVGIDPAILEPKPVFEPLLDEWLKPTSRYLESRHLLIAHQASALIAINCLMLSVSALATFRATNPGHLWWAFIPLTLTNVLSLSFAVLCARVETVTTLDEVCAMAEDEYSPALSLIVQDQAHLVASLGRDLRVGGVAIALRQKHLRTAYAVLLGGIVLSTAAFGLCLAVLSRG